MVHHDSLTTSPRVLAEWESCEETDWQTERERCARIAEEERDQWLVNKTLGPSSAWVAANLIVRKIRGEL